MPRHTRTHTHKHTTNNTHWKTLEKHIDIIVLNTRAIPHDPTSESKKHVISHDYLWCVILFSKSFRFFPTKKTSNTWVPHEAHRGRHIHSCSACGAATSTASRAFGWFWGFGESWHAGTGEVDHPMESYGNPMEIPWESYKIPWKSSWNAIPESFDPSSKFLGGI